MSSVLERSPVEVLSPTEERPYLFSTEEFYRMLELEIFPSEARVGLWEGRIYEKMAKTQAHTVAGNKANLVLTRLLPPAWFVGSENPFTVSPDKAPLPDLIVLRGVPDDYLSRRPVGADVGLIIESSLTSLKIDTGPKLADYARAGVVAYWVLNLKDGVILAYSDPIASEGRYASMTTVAPGQSIPFHLEGQLVAQIAASDLLPGH